MADNRVLHHGAALSLEPDVDPVAPCDPVASPRLSNEDGAPSSDATADAFWQWFFDDGSDDEVDQAAMD